MYFVDREKINQTLVYMEKLQYHLPALADPKQFTEKLALERIAGVIIESIIDVGNSMIDGFIMRDPGSYEDIIDILEDEKVIQTEEAVELKALIDLRKHIVLEYTAIDHQLLCKILAKSEQALAQFANNIRRYLHEELGPVSAFLPNDEKSQS